MLRATTAALLLCSLALGGAQDVSAPPDGDFAHVVRPFLEQHCIACHGPEMPEAGLDLSWYETAERALEEPDEWEEIHARVEGREMPPAGQLQPSSAERRRLLGWIEHHFGFESTDAGPIDPGRPVLRRLNHTEYRNTVRDLFGVDFPSAERFGSEAAGFGFDTVGEALSISELMFEKYVDAAEWIARRAIVLPEPGPPRERVYTSNELGGDGRPGDGVWVLFTRGDASVQHRFPRAGEYLLRVRAWAQQAGPAVARMELRFDRRRLARFDVEATRGASEAYVSQLEVGEGPHTIAARFTNDYYDPEDPDPTNRDRNLLIESIEVVGPLDPPPTTAFQGELLRRFGPELGGRRSRAILEHMATRAWRRPVEPRELGRLERLCEEQEGLEAQLQLGLQAILASPSFLFRVEADPPELAVGSVRALDGHELATRLSYFLWSTTPDEELTSLAQRGALVEEEVLRGQVARMLADPRSRALADGFAAQWLKVQSLARAAVDPKRFPGFDRELRAAMREETLAVFDALLREERSLWELLDGDTSFLNARLAAHYGVPGVEGDQLRRVSLAGTPRRGVLGHGSVLTVTSDPTRTSPVKRGKWVLETLLGSAPPPPPPGAGALDESAEAAAAASLRERLEQHRADPACAVCHDVLDPLGFALENYDAVGAWREADGGFAIDASGALPDGRAFRGPRELAAFLRADEAFLRNIVERLLVYALGRGLERTDRRTVDAVFAGLDPERPTLRAAIEGLVLSDAFRKRRVRPAD